MESVAVREDVTNNCNRHSKAVEKLSQGPPVLELGDAGWRVLNQRGRRGSETTSLETRRMEEGRIELREGSMRNSVHIEACAFSEIKLCLKFNSLRIIECYGLYVEVQSLVSTLEIINAERVEIHITHTTPTVVLDNSTEINIFFHKKEIAEQCTIVTSKISSINISYPKTAESISDFAKSYIEWIELPLPGQYLHKLVDGKIHSEPIESFG